MPAARWRSQGSWNQVREAGRKRCTSCPKEGEGGAGGEFGKCPKENILFSGGVPLCALLWVGLVMWQRNNQRFQHLPRSSPLVYFCFIYLVLFFVYGCPVHDLWVMIVWEIPSLRIIPLCWVCQLELNLESWVEITKSDAAGKGYELWACNEFAMNMNGKCKIKSLQIFANY